MKYSWRFLISAQFTTVAWFTGFGFFGGVIPYGSTLFYSVASIFNKRIAFIGWIAELFTYSSVYAIWISQVLLPWSLPLKHNLPAMEYFILAGFSVLLGSLSAGGYVLGNFATTFFLSWGIKRKMKKKAPDLYNILVNRK